MLEFDVSFSGVMMGLCTVALGFFSAWRYRFYRRDPTNQINYHYWIASATVTLGFIFYAIAGFLAGDDIRAVLIRRDSAIAATLLNAVGFSHFLMVGLYSWLSERGFLFSRHLLYLLVCILALLFVFTPPAPILDQEGIMHWHFSRPTAFIMLAIMGSAFSANIILLSFFFKRLRALSFLNVSALIIAFLLTGFGGAYLYVGDSGILLRAAMFTLFIGLCSTFFAAVHDYAAPEESDSRGRKRGGILS